MVSVSFCGGYSLSSPFVSINAVGTHSGNSLQGSALARSPIVFISVALLISLEFSESATLSYVEVESGKKT